MKRIMSQQFSNAYAPVWVACTALTGFLSCLSARASAPQPITPAVTAFAHVCVLPMDTNRVLHDQTVLVQGGKIAAIGSSVPVPTDATVIDGHGSACLSPGLADMHIHTDTIEDMKLFLANGVTAVLITGTDTPSIPGLVPGYSLHDDMDALEAAGLSRYEILAAATRTPGELIRRSLLGSEPFGTIAVGNRADLVLSATDPLGDLSTLRKPLGVMANGKWYTQADLQALLDQVAKEYKNASNTESSQRRPSVGLNFGNYGRFGSSDQK